METPPFRKIKELGKIIANKIPARRPPTIKLAESHITGDVPGINEMYLMVEGTTDAELELRTRSAVAYINLLATDQLGQSTRGFEESYDQEIERVTGLVLETFSRDTLLKKIGATREKRISYIKKLIKDDPILIFQTELAVRLVNESIQLGESMEKAPYLLKELEFRIGKRGVVGQKDPQKKQTEDTSDRPGNTEAELANRRIIFMVGNLEVTEDEAGEMLEFIRNNYIKGGDIKVAKQVLSKIIRMADMPIREIVKGDYKKIIEAPFTGLWRARSGNHRIIFNFESREEAEGEKLPCMVIHKVFARGEFLSSSEQ